MPSVPQGFSEEHFAELSARVRAQTGHISEDIRAHGSRVSGKARLDSDLDIAVIIGAERFEQFLVQRFGVPNPGSAKERTMRHARETGKIQAGEAGLRRLRNEVEELLGIEVDISVIREGGQFDQGPYLPLLEAHHLPEGE